MTKTEDRYIREHTRPGVTYASDQERLRREYRAKYGGRGKYQRQVFQYAYTVYDRKGERLESGLVYGRRELHKEKQAIRSRQRKRWYRIEVWNNTKNRKLRSG